MAGALQRLQPLPRRLLHHRVVQQGVHQPLHSDLIQVALQEVEIRYRDGLHAADAQRLHLPQQPQPARIRKVPA